MSRVAASKTRGVDKTKPPASQTPQITHEIVPGKFNDNDWSSMLDRDGGEEFVLDIVDELMDMAMEKIYDNYIEHQLLPFTITQAREAIVEIIEWQFLARDEGEDDIETDLGWMQDEEPEPAETDCWAQGSVPRNLVLAPTPELEDIQEETEEVPVEAEELTETEENEPQEPIELEDVVSEPDESPEIVTFIEKIKTPTPPSIPVPKPKVSKTKFKPYRGKLKSAGVSKMTESLEDSEMNIIYNEIVASLPPNDDKPNTLLNMPASCTSILKVQTGRPPGNKDVIYDEMGNVVAVMKLDPEKLPTHKINVKYHVVDPAVEAAQARLDAMRKGKSTGSRIRKVKTTKSLDSAANSGGATKTKTTPTGQSMAPLPPPLVEDKESSDKIDQSFMKSERTYRIEEMEVANGVIVREGGRVKKGPGRYYGKLDILEDHQKGMKPMTVRLTNAGITVNDILDRNTPILRPLTDTAPLPPIIAQHTLPSQSSQVS